LRRFVRVPGLPPLDCAAHPPLEDHEARRRAEHVPSIEIATSRRSTEQQLQLRGS